MSEANTEVWLIGPVPPAPRLSHGLPLSTQEWATAQRYRQDADRAAFIAGRVLTRVLLGRWGDCDPREINLQPDARGRPKAVRPTRLQGYGFSISHTRGLTGVALNATGAIGLDIEPLDRNVELSVMADPVLTAREVEALRAVPADVARLRFLRLWTLKEAYLKARGLGIAAGLTSIAFELDPLVAILPADDDEAAWMFEERQWPTGHLLALCRAAGSAPPFYRDVAGDEEIAALFGD